MSFSDAELVALVDAGVTAAQLVAAIIAGREANRAKRAARLAGKMNEADSVRVADPDTSPGRAVTAAPPVSVGGPVKDRARRAAMLSSALRPAARRVLGQLIEHHNLRTGRCDPSVGRIAGILGLSDRSVRRALAQLEAGGLVARVIHGGQRHANAYRLDFAAMDRMGLGGGAATRTLESADPDSGVRQNLPRNLKPSGREERPQRAKLPDRRQGFLPLPIPGGRANVAAGQAEARVWRDIRHRWGDSETALSVVIGLDQAVFSEAHGRERDRPGTGIGVIERALRAVGG